MAWKASTWLVLDAEIFFTPPPPVCFWVCSLVPTARPRSHLFIHSYTSSLPDTSADSQHKSCKLPRPKSLSQDTKESFLRICNKALRRFTGLTTTRCYLFKPNPTYMGQKASRSQHPRLLHPSTTSAMLLTCRTEDRPLWDNRRSETISCNLETPTELHYNPPNPSLRLWAAYPAANFRRVFSTAVLNWLLSHSWGNNYFSL